MTNKTYGFSKMNLSEWVEFSRRDDCLERMVPSDLRELVGALKRHEDAAAARRRVRHVKRGSSYVVLGVGEVQISKGTITKDI